MRAAKMHGAVLRRGTVVGLVRGPGAALRGVALAIGEIEGDAVVIAMGPWSILAARWLPLPAVWGCKGHSPVFETGETIPAEALFLAYREASGEILTPELFPRADGTPRACAISTIGPVPVDPATNGFGYWIPALPRVNGVPADLVDGVPRPGVGRNDRHGRCGTTRRVASEPNAIPSGNPALQRTLILRQFWHAELLRHFLCLLPSLARNPFDEVLEHRTECGMCGGGVELYSFFRRQQWPHICQE
jgi:glycine/D-amino acid oxidase-like deaminating enzyme